MRELIDGSTAIVRGALEAGCTFFAGYPITPASGVLMGMLRELPSRGGTGFQAEDEIAAAGACVGAALAGARAMTATSGPGISLMSETIGLAVMGEVPLVVVDVQRMGPATGGATTVAQGDVQFVRWGTSGGYPVIVLAPSTVAECTTLTRRAFELSERFRCPVFLLADKELALTTTTVDVVTHSLPPPDVESSRACVGVDVPVRFTGSTHDEHGFLTKDPEKVGRLNERLRAKIEDHVAAIAQVDAALDPAAETLVISYGITAGAVRDAARRCAAERRPVSTLVVQSLWPVPETLLRDAVGGHARVVVAELNHGQYRREIERLVDRRVDVVGVHRTDGELITPEQILEHV